MSYRHTGTGIREQPLYICLWQKRFKDILGKTNSWTERDGASVFRIVGKPTSGCDGIGWERWDLDYIWPWTDRVGGRGCIYGIARDVYYIVLCIRSTTHHSCDIESPCWRLKRRECITSKDRIKRVSQTTMIDCCWFIYYQFASLLQLFLPFWNLRRFTCYLPYFDEE